MGWSLEVGRIIKSNFDFIFILNENKQNFIYLFIYLFILFIYWFFFHRKIGDLELFYPNIFAMGMA